MKISVFSRNQATTIRLSTPQICDKTTEYSELTSTITALDTALFEEILPCQARA